MQKVLGNGWVPTLTEKSIKEKLKRLMSAFRQFSEMMDGLDRNINSLVESASKILGENTSFYTPGSRAG